MIKPEWNVNSLNPLHLMINRVCAYRKNGIKFLTIDKGDCALKKYNQVFAGIKYHIGKIDGAEVI